MYYAISKDNEFSLIAFNATSRFDVKETVLNLFKPYLTAEDFKRYCETSIDDLCLQQGWKLNRSEQKFELRPNYRIVAAVTNYHYLDVRANNQTEAREIGKATDLSDYYTMVNPQYTGSFNIVKVNPIL